MIEPDFSWWSLLNCSGSHLVFSAECSIKLSKQCPDFFDSVQTFQIEGQGGCCLPCAHLWHTLEADYSDIEEESEKVSTNPRFRKIIRIPICLCGVNGPHPDCQIHRFPSNMISSYFFGVDKRKGVS